MSFAGRTVPVSILTVVISVVSLPKTALSAVSFTGDVTLGTTTTVGNTSFGTFRIDGGSVYSNSNQSLFQFNIGSQTNSLGLMTVTDPGSQLIWVSSSGSLSVGTSGTGRLDILNGASVVTGTSSGSVAIATNSGGQGTINVQGAGSTLYTGGLTLGQSSSSGGSALLQIGNGAIVNSTATSNGTSIAIGGRVELSGGLLRTYSLSQQYGTIIGNGEVSIQSSSTLTNSGRLEADTNQLLRFTGYTGSSAYNNNGTIIVDGGEMEFQRMLANSTSGPNAAEISLRNGRLRAGTASSSSSAQLTNSGNLISIGGESDVYGRVSNSTTGHIAATNNSVLRFHDDVTADGIVTVFPGSRAIFLEDLTMNAGSTLQANLAGIAPTTSYGTAEVVGTATFAGSVSVGLEEGYVPGLGNSFVLLSAGAIDGSPTLGQVPALASGLAWDLDADGGQLVLSVVPALAGDYNANGVVDGADYAVWRKSEGQRGHGLPADGTGNGVVDADDLAFWRANFGATSAGLGSAAAVPEPTSAILLIAALFVAPFAGRKRVAI